MEFIRSFFTQLKQMKEAFEVLFFWTVALLVGKKLIFGKNFSFIDLNKYVTSEVIKDAIRIFGLSVLIFGFLSLIFKVVMVAWCKFVRNEPFKQVLTRRSSDADTVAWIVAFTIALIIL